MSQMEDELSSECLVMLKVAVKCYFVSILHLYFTTDRVLLQVSEITCD